MGSPEAVTAAGGRGALERERRIAFGPFLALGTWLVWLHGPIVIG